MVFCNLGYISRFFCVTVYEVNTVQYILYCILASLTLTGRPRGPGEPGEPGSPSSP